MGLEWNWLCLPYLLCAAALIAVAVIAAVIRGDRVMRLGAIGAATNAVPWALVSAVVTWTDDPEIATMLLRLGNGPIALVGPSFLLVLLGVSGQLERNRWLARTAGLIGVGLSLVCWTTDWTIAGVQELGSGIFYPAPGPLTGIHFSQVALWLLIGIAIARRTTGSDERKKLVHLLVLVLALGAVGGVDMLLVYDIAGSYPIAWGPILIAALLSIYYELRSDLLRPQGIDYGVVIEILAFAGAAITIAAIALVLEGTAAVILATAASAAWAVTLGIAWARTRERPVRIASERALEELVASLGEVDTDAAIGERLAELWRHIGIETHMIERVEGELLVTVGAAELRALPPTGGNTRPLDRELADWFVAHDDVLSAGDLGTALLGPIRPKLERLFAARGATLIVPLVDRGSLVGMVEADHEKALREEERGLIVESARATARALTFVALSRTAAREYETAREVEVAEAMRLQASASRDDELGRWAVAAEYRTARRTTGAGWSASLLPDGRLAVLVTEAQAHGVAAALATAALTGAFAAATQPSAAVNHLELDDLMASLRASVEGVVRGGEPVGAFIAILDGEAKSIAWASAGHPGALIVGPAPEAAATASSSGLTSSAMVLGGGGARLGASLEIATRGTTKLTPGSQLVIASTGLRDDDDIVWMGQVRAAAPAGPRLASVLVDVALARGEPHEDLLAVVVRQQPQPR
ncbi:MAG: SpoIIE family protein phosphatase [Deltaproteobacteria bacterium]|nr:SpoIIE family protein phosphatase [Deltaproteobacteria bacterium]